MTKTTYLEFNGHNLSKINKENFQRKDRINNFFSKHYTNDYYVCFYNNNNDNLDLPLHFSVRAYELNVNNISYFIECNDNGGFHKDHMKQIAKDACLCYEEILRDNLNKFELYYENNIKHIIYDPYYQPVIGYDIICVLNPKIYIKFYDNRYVNYRKLLGDEINEKVFNV